MTRPSFLTPQGWEQLRAEHQQRWERRRETVIALAAAAAEGDRSENAEYIYRKKELREIDRRLRYLGRILNEAKVVDALPADCSRVRFGAWVSLHNAAGEQRQIRIVGAYEARPEQGEISLDAPLAKLLLGRAVDDSIVWQRGDSPAEEWEITEIRYAPPQGSA